MLVASSIDSVEVFCPSKCIKESINLAEGVLAGGGCVYFAGPCKCWAPQKYCHKNLDTNRHFPESAETQPPGNHKTTSKVKAQGD